MSGLLDKYGIEDELASQPITLDGVLMSPNEISMVLEEAFDSIPSEEFEEKPLSVFKAESADTIALWGFFWGGWAKKFTEVAAAANATSNKQVTLLEAYRKAIFDKVMPEVSKQITTHGDASFFKTNIAGLLKYVCLANERTLPNNDIELVLTRFAEDLKTVEKQLTRIQSDSFAILDKVLGIVSGYVQDDQTSFRKSVLDKIAKFPKLEELAEAFELNATDKYAYKTVFFIEKSGQPMKHAPALDLLGEPATINLIYGNLLDETYSRLAKAKVTPSAPPSKAKPNDDTKLVLDVVQVRRLCEIAEGYLDLAEEQAHQNTNNIAKVNGIVSDISERLANVTFDPDFGMYEDMKMVRNYVANIARIHTKLIPRINQRNVHLSQGIMYLIDRLKLEKEVVRSK